MSLTPGGTRRRRVLAAGLAGAAALSLAAGVTTVSGAAESKGSPGTTAAGGTWQTLESGGLARRYVLAVPSGTAAGPRPLVVVLHGLAQKTVPFLATTGLVAAANSAGVIVAAPETPDGSWNDGRFGPGGRNDDAFVTALVNRLVGTGLVDRSRVTLTGFSNGAGMSMELIARHPARFAALVSVGGTLLATPDAPRPTAPIQAVFLHGDSDLTQPWMGRERRGPRLPPQEGEPTTVAAFRAADGTLSDAAVTSFPARRGAKTGVVTRYSWTPGHGGPGVTLYRIAGGTHAWPGLAPHARPGTQPGSIDATSVVVATAASARLAPKAPVGRS